MARTCCLLEFLIFFFLSVAATSGCHTRDIRISQGPTGFSGQHIPEYTVEIVNAAPEKNGVYNVKIACGDFASAILVNPNTFKRVSSGVCSLKNGGKLAPGEVVSFTYANSLPYHFSIINVNC